MIEHIKPRLDVTTLTARLISSGIDVTQWRKSVQDLLNEVLDGETELADENSQLIRITNALGLDVFVSHDGGLYQLVEQKQVFPDGSSRQRALSTSLGEKMKLGEPPELAAMRALYEELGIDGAELEIRLGEIETRERTSGSYPGLITRINLRYAAVMLRPEQYVAGGYTEQQPNKTSYFVWQLIEPEQQ